MKFIFRAALLAGIALVAWPLMAQNTSGQTDKGKNQTDKEKNQQQESREGVSEMAYLGVGVSPVPPGLGSHMKEQISPGQGLLVDDVADNSAAEKGGIKEDDILLRYDDQKLFSPEQLARLVQSDKAGRDATIELLRNGKREKIHVTLGQRPNDENRNWADRTASRNGQNENGRRFSRRPDLGNNSAWEDFDSLSLKKLGKDKFRAEVQYLDKDNKTRKHVFEGTREEIRKDIQSQKDLKPEEREQLLRSLGLTSSDQNQFGRFGFPPAFGWYFEPDNQYD